ncbi:MAG: NAD(P)H-quinone oxidoreductase [Actinomycetota bacterium]
MRAVVLESYGEAEVLQLKDVPEPEPGPEEVLVEVAATALNRADLLQRRGLYASPLPADHEIPGLELSGTVVAAGPRCLTLTPGDHVMGIVAGGAYAERVTVHERQLVPTPSSVELHDAAAIPEVFITAWDALVLQGGLTSGRTALVHAGASGVGTAAIQICKAIGAHVIVTASTTKVDACRALGADQVVDYTTQDFGQVARDVDVVLDVIGGEYLDRNIDALRTGGRIIQVGVMGDQLATFPLGKLLYKRAGIIGTVLRARPLEEKIAVTQRFRHEVLPLFDDGRLHPVIDRRYELAAIADAHRYMESNANVGKIVVDVTNRG